MSRDSRPPYHRRKTPKQVRAVSPDEVETMMPCPMCAPTCEVCNGTKLVTAALHARILASPVVEERELSVADDEDEDPEPPKAA